MIRKTIILVDYNTQETARVFEHIVGVHNVLIMPFGQLPEMPISTSSIQAVILLCTKPDDDVLQSLQTLRLCYSHIKIIVLSPQPTPSMVTQTIRMGAHDYLDFATLDDGNLTAYLRQTTKTKQPLFSIFAFFEKILEQLMLWVQAQKDPTKRIQANSMNVLPQILTHLPEKWTISDENPPPQYNNFIKVQFFGDFTIEMNEKTIKPKNNSLLLAFLLFNHSRPIHKENLMSKFWGDNVNDAKNCLNAAIFSLRKLFSDITAEKTIVFENDYYAINTAVWHIESDADIFIKHWEKARTLIRTQGLEAAIAELNMLKSVYRDDFLPNFSHDWALSKRDDFREKYLQTLNLLSEYFWKTQKLTDCIDACHDILRIDDCLEPAHRRLIECYMVLKMKDKAIRQYKKCVESLKKLNISPENETDKLYASILKV